MSGICWPRPLDIMEVTFFAPININTKGGFVKLVALFLFIFSVGSFLAFAGPKFDNLDKSVNKIDGIEVYKDKSIKFLMGKEAFAKYEKEINVSWPKMTSEQKSTAIDKYSTGIYMHLVKDIKSSKVMPKLSVRLGIGLGASFDYMAKYKIVIDGEQFEFPVDDRKSVRENDAYAFVETVEKECKEADLKMIQKLVGSKEAIIRLYLQNGHMDHVVSAKEKSALKNVIEALQELK